MRSAARHTLVGRSSLLVLTVATMALATLAHQNSDAGSLCFTGSSYQNASGHWIITSSITNKNGRLPGESTRDAPSWTYDLEFRSFRVNKRPALKTTIIVSGLPSTVGYGYTFVEGLGYYRLHTTKKDWLEAKKTCEEEGGHLLIINSKEEENAIINLMKGKISTKDDVFIGISDIENEGKYVTVLGEPFSSVGYASWDNGEPNNAYPGENCGNVRTSGKINDLECDLKRFFLCEIPNTVFN